jgi:hypothetical protein
MLVLVPVRMLHRSSESQVASGNLFTPSAGLGCRSRNHGDLVVVAYLINKPHPSRQISGVASAARREDGVAARFTHRF